MTNNNHPITLPPELQEKWLDMWPQESLLEAVRWGADQELDACCEWVNQLTYYGDELRTVRRPKPKSRKQRALDALTQIEDQRLSAELATEVRNALEELPDG